MIDITAIDYSHLDLPEILMFLFHPRPEWGGSGGPGEDLLIPVEQDVSIGARLHFHDAQAPTILFFHGNGEIVADYDDLGPLYVQNGINFLPVDYRGYGRSGGSPSVTAMMRDCHVIFDFVRDWLEKKGHSGPLVVMGRSLGSASALELAAHYEEAISGLIIESGFALAGPLLRLLGLDTEAMEFKEEAGFRNVDKIARYHKPTLVIHAQYDHIIPLSDGVALFEASQARNKRFLEIKGANHNDIFLRGLDPYMRAIKELMDKL
ncbi:MAG: alpha/beta fold hydrolase [Deltaproteobacteria bacterium]|nr:alpha/beta fold hydrolase [Deltaproteobacteria bacterium]MBW1925286.1 alpha/beta fold hydrolase [Deltaproteobacteria bacterium]MBW1949983.1 alpha/beta fold hydrolase [Deltaproteobacteria bacterium]MBW2007855.1 alpha/beta fold hydrolase [Deltaproteobacteria bacterium]MBW2102749.1 alpha/beta fold hydrolase [Deltaproteobacteria bacterium]